MDRGAQKRRQSALKINLKSTDGLYMKTVNPCNDFLVDFLIASKLKSEKQGIGKFTTYNLAIQSVRKYPLPLICEAQLAALEGFGDFFINEAAKRIQKHYKRGRLPTQQQIQQDDRQHFAALQANRRKGYKKKKIKSQDQQQDQQNEEENQQKQEQQGEVDQEEKQKQNSQSNSLQKKQKVAPSVASSSKNSKRSKTIQNYKPRPESQSQKILKAMYLLRATQKYVSKGQINQIFYNWSKDSVKSWQFCRTRLKQSGYIQFDKVQKDLAKLSKKGCQFITKRMGKLRHTHDSQKNKLNEKIEKKLLTDPETKIKVYSFSQSSQLTIILSEKPIVVSEKKIIRTLLQDQKEAIKQILQQQGQHRVDYQQLEGGSFIWQIDGQVLDYTVLRVMLNWELDQADLQDNGQSFKNFNKDKFLMAYEAAKLGEFANITVITEDQKAEQYEPKSLNQSTRLKQKQYYRQRKQQYRQYVESIIVQCRAAGVKILRTSNYAQTLAFISQVTSILKQKIDGVKQIGGLNVLGSIESVNKRINRKKMLATLYKRCLRFLIDNKDAALQMTLKFGTFKNTQAKIIRNSFDQTLYSKKKILKNLFKNCELKVADQTVDQIINFFFSDSYEE